VTAAYYPDRGERRGPLRVLPRTDGGCIVYDERRPVGSRTRAAAATFEQGAILLHEIADAEGIARGA
jgi:hypothetical protein